MKEIKEQLNRIESVLEKVAINSAQNTESIEEIKDEISNLNNEVTEIKKEAKITKLELLDKLASKDTTDNHELRIANVEEKVFN